ncbi:unnamed protein product [Rhizophagus irregularis]|nr:unnamed protein product [Rhizophagus irregularis]CAB5092930.1 unnamed protein product [Rhizophagus irregularis]
MSPISSPLPIVKRNVNDRCSAVITNVITKNSIILNVNHGGVVFLKRLLLFHQIATLWFNDECTGSLL